MNAEEWQALAEFDAETLDRLIAANRVAGARFVKYSIQNVALVDPERVEALRAAAIEATRRVEVYADIVNRTRPPS